MGFLGTLVEGAQALANTVGNWTRNAVETVSNCVRNTYNWCRQQMQNLGRGKVKILEDPPPPPLSPIGGDDSGVVININRCRLKLANKIEALAADLEDSVVTVVDACFDNLFAQIQNEDEQGAARLQYRSYEIRRKVENATSDYISMRTSASNRRCRNLLEMEPGDERTAKWRKFKESVIEGVKKIICDNIEMIVQDEWNNVTKVVVDKLKEEEQEGEAEIKKLGELINDTKQDVGKKKKHIADRRYCLAVYLCADDVLKYA